MKTLRQINDEILRLAKDKQEAEEAHERRKASSIQREIDQLRFFRLYLETNPRPEVIQKMRGDVIQKIKILEDRFPLWLSGQVVSGETKALQAKYYATAGIPELKSRLKALNYLCEQS